MTRPKQFDLIVFDWDGTLFDSTALIVRCLQAACRDIGTPVPSDNDAAFVIGLSLAEALRRVAPTLPQQHLAEFSNRYRHHYFGQHHEVTLFPGILEMLHALKARHHWLAVATGKGRRGLDEALANAQLKGMFDATRTADETASKPDPRMLLELMREFGAEPERTVMVGDTTHDLLLAQNAGTVSVAVSYGAHEPEAFAAFEPRAIVHTPGELHDWLIEHA